MYEIYKTPALILDVKNLKEANRMYWLFTRDYGLVLASAQGVRKVASKLNSFLQQYDFVDIELIKGREFWRVTNASSPAGFDFGGLGRKKQSSVARMTLLLKKLFVGEEAHSELFEQVNDSFLALQNADKENIENVETMMVLKILHHLGYWEEQIEHYPLHLSPITAESLQTVQENKKDLVKKINASLRQTHL
jgi:DNA repair protein RecO (recombination protein O)